MIDKEKHHDCPTAPARRPTSKPRAQIKAQIEETTSDYDVEASGSVLPSSQAASR